MSEHTKLARRHLLTALGIGAVALRSKVVHAQPVPPSGDDDLYWPPLQSIPPWYGPWTFQAGRNIGHYYAFFGTPYPQSLFNNDIATLGPPPKSILDFLNANPVQAPAPLGIPAGTYTFNYPGYSPSGPGIEDNSTYWPPLQQVPQWYGEWAAQLRDISHYQGFIGPLPQSYFNEQYIAQFGPPPEGILDIINAGQPSAPLGIPAGTYTFNYPGYSPSASCFLRGTPIRVANGERAVEDLAIGDLVVTAHRGLQPVQAIKRFPHDRAVRVARSAVADDVPHSDLYVTGEHALLIDGLFVMAGSLVNGTTIDYANKPSEYFHIELPIYDAVYAAGLPCESYTIAQRTVIGFWNSRQRMASHLRSAVAPWWDIRCPVDIMRERTEARALF
jgi:hypothetical protein